MKHFNEDQVINLIQSVGKIGGATLATYGVQASNLWASAVGMVVALVSVWFSHQSNATATPASASAPGIAPADNTGKLPPIILCAILAIGVVGFFGCAKDQLTTAYRAETATDTGVTTLWKLWQAYLVANPSTPATTRVKVAAAFQKVKAAELVTIDATATLAESTNGVSVLLTNDPTVLNAFQDLQALLATFNIKL